MLFLRSRVLPFAVALAALAASAATAQAAGSGRIYFPRNVLPLAHATSLGSASGSQRIVIGIGLKNPHPAKEAALLAAEQNPASPQYHHFLTPAQFDQRFAVTNSTFSRLRSWLKAGGARITETSSARNFVEFSATSSQVDKLFRTQINRYSAKGVTFLANRSEPSVPAGLHVLAIMGLNTLNHPTTPLSGAHRGALAPGSAKLGLSTAPQQLSAVPGEKALLSALGSAVAKATASAPQIPASLSPQDMWSIYDMPANNTGQGQSIAIMGEGDSSTTIKDLAKFESEHKLPTVPVKLTRIPRDGDFSDTGGNVEWELDTQASTGVAPSVKQVHLYFAQHLTDPDAESDFATWADDPNGPKQANASFGECESTPEYATIESTVPKQFNNNQDPNAFYGTGFPDALEPVADQTLEQAAVEGRTLFASTGDTGSSCPVLVLGPLLGAGNGVLNQGVPIVNYPAVSPFAVAVGGSVLYPDGSTPPQRGLEYPWPYTGGGQSFFVARPSFQNGDANVNRPCLTDLQGHINYGVKPCRGIPDVAAESGDIATSSYDIYSDELGGDSGEGGTSLSSPLMVGMWTRIQAASKTGTGFADPDIYKVAEKSASYAKDFYDYQLGSNGAYTAGPGWDYVSGWGTPVLTPLMTDIDGGNTRPVR